MGNFMIYKYGAFGRFKKSIDGKFLCKKCSCYKFPIEFFRSKRPCALSSACKECHYEGVKNWRDRNKEKMVSYALKWNRLHPDAHEAHRLVKNALKNKSLERQPCEKCDSVESQAHHDDYSKPLEVKWLCPKHHVQHHQLI